MLWSLSIVWRHSENVRDSKQPVHVLQADPGRRLELVDSWLFGARLTGWEASFGHLINLHLSSHPNITTCWSSLWGDSVSPERDLPDSCGEGGCRCLAEGCLRARLKKAARRFVVLKVGCNCVLQCSTLPLPSS